MATCFEEVLAFPSTKQWVLINPSQSSSGQRDRMVIHLRTSGKVFLVARAPSSQEIFMSSRDAWNGDDHPKVMRQTAHEPG